MPCGLEASSFILMFLTLERVYIRYFRTIADEYITTLRHYDTIYMCSTKLYGTQEAVGESTPGADSVFLLLREQERVALYNSLRSTQCQYPSLRVPNWK
jgi:hypothetical protein